MQEPGFSSGFRRKVYWNRMNRIRLTAGNSSVPALPLEITSLVKRFGQVTALDGVSLELHDWRVPGTAGAQRGRQKHIDSQHRGACDSGRGQRDGVRQPGQLKRGPQSSGMGSAGPGSLSAAYLQGEPRGVWPIPRAGRPANLRNRWRGAWNGRRSRTAPGSW